MVSGLLHLGVEFRVRVLGLGARSWVGRFKSEGWALRPTWTPKVGKRTAQNP